MQIPALAIHVQSVLWLRISDCILYIIFKIPILYINFKISKPDFLTGSVMTGQGAMVLN